MPTRYFLEVMYNGLAFHGSQIQHNLPTVQLALNQALKTLLREDISTFGASRTDEGVHALCNVYHFDSAKPLRPGMLYNLNAILPDGISAVSVKRPVDQQLNARFAAISRSYRYRIFFRKDPFLIGRAFFFPYKCDFGILQQTAEELIRHSDFTTFAKRNAQTKTNQCHLFESRWEQHGEEWYYVVKGNRFLRGMVRALVGTQLQVGRGRLDMNDFRTLIELKDNAGADFSVPGYGLYLEQISYPEGTFLEELIA